jgi:FAD synthetase
METLTVSYKEGLQQIISERAVKGIILGTRRCGLAALRSPTEFAFLTQLAVALGPLSHRGDPNAGDQEHFSPSTKGWPPFMRINPVLEWTYHEVRICSSNQ